MELARDLIGASAMLAGGDAPDGDDPIAHPHAGSLDHAGWHHGFLFSQALTIGGGTWAVQRNIVAERVLGLPHDVDDAAGLTWAEAQRRR